MGRFTLACHYISAHTGFYDSPWVVFTDKLSMLSLRDVSLFLLLIEPVPVGNTGPNFPSRVFSSTFNYSNSFRPIIELALTFHIMVQKWNID